MSGADHEHNRAGDWSYFLLRCVLSIVMVLVVSCIDGHEEYWIRSDGSGRAEIRYQIPASLGGAYGGDAGIQQKIVEFLGKTPAVSESACEVVTQGKITTVRVHVGFDSVLDLSKIRASPELKNLPTAVSHLVGDIKVELRGRTLDFKRTADPGKALPGSFFMPTSKFDGHRLVYTLHLPTPVRESNATRIEAGGRTLIWDVPLKNAVKSPVVSRFSMEIPIPWAALSVAGVLLVLVVGCVIFCIRRRRSIILSAGKI